MSGARRILIAVLIVVLVALGIGGIMLSQRSTDSSAGRTSGSDASPDSNRNGASSGAPRILSEDRLRELARLRGPVYWAGPRDDAEYELTTLSGGTTYIRYLTEGAEAGTDSDDYLSVATYPIDNGYEILRRAGRADDATVERGARGALIVETPLAPRSAYFAFKGVELQVEVYAPRRGEAKRLVDSGDVEVLE